MTKKNIFCSRKKWYFQKLCIAGPLIENSWPLISIILTFAWIDLVPPISIRYRRNIKNKQIFEYLSIYEIVINVILVFFWLEEGFIPKYCQIKIWKFWIEKLTIFLPYLFVSAFLLTIVGGAVRFCKTTT